MLAPEVLAAIADLELVARVTVDGTVAGLHRSPFHGYSAEFSQYRHYRPGDDLKYVDWKLFARTDRFYTKQYRETTNLPAQIVVDASASMAFAGANGVSKLHYARIITATMAYLIAGQGDAIGLVVHDDAVRQYIPSRPGQSHLRSLLIALSRVVPSGRTAGAAAVRRAAEFLKRRGLLIVLSDLYDDEEAVGTELRRAVRMGHEVAVFQILTREELDFPSGGDMRIEDLETGSLLVTNSAAIREEYQRRVRAFLEHWAARCASEGIDYTLAVTDMPLDAALRTYLLKRRGATAR